MARAIWTGTISFGLVSIPVGLFSATEDHTVHFHQFERGTSDRVRIHRVNERTGNEVAFSEIVKGTEVDDGEYVMVEPDELDAVAPGRSRSLEITDFVDLDEIDPIYFNRTYWLAPTDDEHNHPYGLLLDAMKRTNRAAIGTFVMRGKEYLAAIRADGDVLALETLFFADEVRDPATELDTLPTGRSAGGKELDMATRLVESMSGPWRPESYHDSYRERVAQLVEDKHQGRETVPEPEATGSTGMTDLLDALQRSVDAAGKGTGAARKGTGGDGTGSGDGTGRATKADLLERARDLDVAGRSRMTRDQLAEAVGRAEEGASGGTGRRAS
ncbi:MAG TPA: Ku protein [Pseudonocardia sp.]|jgi:DNA end-binding protein Ku